MGWPRANWRAMIAIARAVEPDRQSLAYHWPSMQRRWLPPSELAPRRRWPRRYSQ